ncbi:MAG: hypothetical protein JF608_02600 [Sphingomonadales bacterium]|nr:hypothetical protein [Sphingomonadales bacterium]
MNSVPARPTPIAKPPIRAWRIVGGVFLHFAVPAYVVTIAVATVFTAPAGAPFGELAHLALGYSGWFLAGYAALALSATFAAAALEPLIGLRHRGRDVIGPGRAATESRTRVTRALAEARTLPGADLRRLVDAIAQPRWNHDDERYQALSRDLAQVAHAMAAANDTASEESRSEILALATRSLQRVEDTLIGLAAEQSRLDHGDASAVARYVENRYGPSDFAGS